MTFLNLNSALEIVLGIIIILGVISLIGSLLERNEKLKNLAKIIWVFFYVVIFNMAAATFYWVLKSKQI